MNWKKALLVALVVLLVLVGVPILMGGMSSAMCHDCGPAVTTGQVCTIFAVLGAFALAIALVSLRLRPRRDYWSELLRAVRIERPPRLA